MSLGLALVVAGIAMRQVDRWWFSDLRAGWRVSLAVRARTVAELFAKQRVRRNNVTPVLAMAGHWVEIAGYGLVAARPGTLPVLLATIAMAVKFRHLQEISHFGVHGCLCRSRRLGDLLTELAVHGPLALTTVDERRTSHVRQHHPNAAVVGVDPNIADLTRAGVYPGCSSREFLAGLLHPCTLRGIGETLRGMWMYGLFGSRTGWRRVPFVAAVGVAAYLLGGVPGLIGLVVARVLLYPQLAWCSLIVEHRWFDSQLRRGRPRVVEAGRCVRLYRGSPVLALVARVTALPYGDLFHYAHSVYPTIRWNYLPAVERLIGLPEFVPSGLVFGRPSVLAALYRSTRGARLVDSRVPAQLAT